MFDKYIEETNRQLNAKEDINGYGYPRAWIDLPTGETAEITFENNEYSALLYDENGNSMLPYLTASSLYELFADIIGE